MGYITPNKYLSSPYGYALRKLIAEQYSLREIVDVSRQKVFRDPSVYPILTFIEHDHSNNIFDIIIKKPESDDLYDVEEMKISSKYLQFFPQYLWGPLLSENFDILHKIYEKSEYLENVADVNATSTAGEADVYTPLINENEGQPIINTGTIDRYTTTWGVKFFVNKRKKMLTPKLRINDKIVNERRRKMYTSPKIIIAKIALRLEGFLDNLGEFSSINTNCIHSPSEGYDLHFLSAIINSKLISVVYAELFNALRMSGGYFQFQAPQLRVLPVYPLAPNEQTVYKKCVNKIISLKKEYIQKVDDFERYWHAVHDEVSLNYYYNRLSVKDTKIIEILEKGKIDNIYVEESDEWIIISSDYYKRVNKQEEYCQKIPIIRLKFKDVFFRKYLIKIIEDNKKKFKIGNISSNILSINIPRFDNNNDKNLSIIHSFMEEYIKEIEEKEKLHQAIKKIDAQIDSYVYQIYDLNKDELLRVEKSFNTFCQ